MNSLEDQLRKLFPDHETENPPKEKKNTKFWIQDSPLLCKYEKRRGKPVTLIEGYNGAEKDFRILTQELKKMFGVGGSYKDEIILIQGDFRKEIMEFLEDNGFQVKRVGG